MSKTVKRVMRVMMVGLFAMLATKAEAHARWYPPLKPFYCPPSVCVGGHVRDDQPDSNSSDIEYGEFRMDNVIGDGLCQGRSETIKLPTMRVRKRIEDIGLLIEKNIEIDTIVAIFPDTFGDIVQCSNGSLPSDSLIRQFSLTGTTFSDVGLVPGACDRGEDSKDCLRGDSTSKITCKLSPAFGLVQFGFFIKRPTFGTLYSCK